MIWYVVNYSVMVDSIPGFNLKNLYHILNMLSFFASFSLFFYTKSCLTFRSWLSGVIHLVSGSILKYTVSHFIGGLKTLDRGGHIVHMHDVGLKLLASFQLMESSMSQLSFSKVVYLALCSL